jgi:hypothetical protein
MTLPFFFDKMIPMNKLELSRKVCAENCFFYKPGKDERLACKGFAVLEKLLEKEQTVPDCEGNIHLTDETVRILFQTICARCLFFAEDCDFAAAGRDVGPAGQGSGLNPCGGFLFLGYCLERDFMNIQAVSRVA